MVLKCQSGQAYNPIFSVSFFLEIIDLPEGQINDPSSGKNFSLPFLPATLLSPSRTIEGLFELTWCSSRALKLASCVASGISEIQGHHQV